MSSFIRSRGQWTETGKVGYTYLRVTGYYGATSHSLSVTATAELLVR